MSTPMLLALAATDLPQVLQATGSTLLIVMAGFGSLWLVGLVIAFTAFLITSTRSALLSEKPMGKHTLRYIFRLSLFWPQTLLRIVDQTFGTYSSRWIPMPPPAKAPTNHEPIGPALSTRAEISISLGGTLQRLKNRRCLMRGEHTLRTVQTPPIKIPSELGWYPYLSAGDRYIEVCRICGLRRTTVYETL